MFKATNVATSLLAALGLFRATTQPPDMSRLMSGFASVHTNKARNAQRKLYRKLCREVGHRQARRLTRTAYALKAARLSA